MYTYLWLIHLDVWQKPTQYYKAVILQLKINFKEKQGFFQFPNYIWDFFLFQLVSAFESNITRNQFSSVAQSCPTLCDPMDCSTPGFPVHHQLSEFTQTHVP